MAAEVAPSLEEISRLSQEGGVEFFFAQFVDMHAPQRQAGPCSAP
jgi:hypothetical protein